MDLGFERFTWGHYNVCQAIWFSYRTTAILLDTFFVWFRVSWEIRLESYGLRHASFALWYDIVWVYCKPVHTSLFRTLNNAWQQNLRTLWLHTTHQATALLPTRHRFITTKVARTLHVAVFFQLIVYANTKMTIRGAYYSTSLRVCCQVAKKGI